jgi:hypothetical protein
VSVHFFTRAGGLVGTKRIATEADSPRLQRIRYVERSASDGVIDIKITLYGPPVIPDVEGAMKLAFEIIHRGERVIDMDGPDDFRLSETEVHKAYSERER